MTTQELLKRNQFAAEKVAENFGIVVKEYHAITAEQKIAVEAAINEKCTVETFACEGETYNFLMLGGCPIYLDTTDKSVHDYDVQDVYDGVSGN